MTAGTICSRVVATASPTESVRAAAQRMAENEVGTLVVIAGDGPGRALGIVTDRDIAVRCVAKNADPDKTVISKVMTAPVQSVDEHTPVEEAVSRMAVSATRRLVVTGAGQRAVGILSLDDVLDVLAEEAGSIARLLEKQKPHVRA
jgi:CBS domain-containing protein